MALSATEANALASSESRILPPSNSIMEILSTPLYVKGLLTNIAFTFGFNFFITKMISNDKPSDWVYFGDQSVNGLVFFFVLIPTLFTALRGSIHQAIVAGKVKPLATTALTDNAFIRGMFYSCCIPSGWLRFIPFMLNGALFPGIAVAVALILLCQSNTVNGECPMSQYGYVLLDATWKTISVIILFTMHFIACHNEAEPEIRLQKVAKKLDETAKSK
eukprot:GILI01012207.1.p1 GENE.GILI01012207.1~~GILI01012207.1.p1  ORF type:complete len:234 (+),score=26.70 GILI01012207.1:46-702(+)